MQRPFTVDEADRGRRRLRVRAFGPWPDQRRRHAVGHRPGGFARHSREEHLRAAADDDRRPEGQLDRPGRRLRHDQGRHQHEEAHFGRQGGRGRRLDDHAQLARDGRCRRRRRDADDFDGGVVAHRRSREPEDEVGVQDAAERLADGRRHRRQHEGERREDDGLHRLRRRLRRRLARRNAALRADGRHQDRRRGEVQPHGHVRHRPGAEARRRQSRRDPDRGGRHARRDAAKGARRPQLQGQDLPDARCGQPRLPARGRQGRQRHDSADRPDARVRAASGLESAQEIRGGVHRQVRGEIRQGFALDVRRSCVGFLSPAVGGDSRGAEESEARHQGIPGRAARRARKRRRSSSRPTACTRCRRPSTTVSTTGRGR